MTILPQPGTRERWVWRRYPLFARAEACWWLQAEPEPFPVRVQSEADLKAAAFEHLIWEDPPGADGSASPIWRQAGMLETAVGQDGADALVVIPDGTDWIGNVTRALFPCWSVTYVPDFLHFTERLLDALKTIPPDPLPRARPALEPAGEQVPSGQLLRIAARSSMKRDPRVTRRITHFPTDPCS